MLKQTEFLNQVQFAEVTLKKIMTNSNSTQKKDCTMVYKKNAESALPEELRSVLGALDQTNYTPSDEEEFFALQQTKEGKTDVYCIHGFLSSYDILAENTQSALSPKLNNVIKAGKKWPFSR